MKITYTSPNRSHHYPYATAMNNKGVLEKFVTGFSRLSKNASCDVNSEKIKRVDLFQTLYIIAMKLRLPQIVINFFNRMSIILLDRSSYSHACNSDVFIYYRTSGYFSTKKLKKLGHKTICILEEVNSHVDETIHLMSREFKLVYEKEYDYNYDIPDYKKRLEAYGIADYILVPSKFAKETFIKRGFSEKKIIDVNFGVDKKSYNTFSPKKNIKFTVLYVGQLHFRKGLRYAIEAFSQLEATDKEFIIVGPLTNYPGIDINNLPIGVKWMGELKGDELKMQYDNASVFVLPSVEEGLALVQAEALSHGNPVISTKNTGGEDIIIHGSNGFIVDAFCYEGIHKYLDLLLNDRSLLEKMQRDAFESYLKLKCWDETMNVLLQQINDKNLQNN